MKLRLDKFTLIVLGIVALLIVAAVVTVNRGPQRSAESYRTADSPETPVVNAFLALQDGDLATARAQYSQKVLKEADKAEYATPLRGQAYYASDSARRLRVTETRPDPADPERMYVSVAIDTYNSGGIFDSGNTYTSERAVEVVREEGAWKINVDEYFY
jgi:hypothetical protein